MREVAKLERNGMVAVLVSPGFGAGWSTWCHEDANKIAMIFDPEIVLAVLDGDHARAEAAAGAVYPNEYLGGVKQLTVEWVPKGTRFEIHEYDGSESLRIFEPDDGYVA